MGVNRLFAKLVQRRLITKYGITIGVDVKIGIGLQIPHPSSITIGEAADYYLGTYEDGREAYLMDEDIEIFQMFSRNGTPEGKEYQCTVKAVNPAKTTDFEYVFYSVTCSQFLGMQQDGEQLYNLRTQHEFFESHPVEKALAKYLDGVVGNENCVSACK